MRSFSRYIDGYYGTPRRISRTPREYPFRHLGDLTTAIYSADYLVDQAAFIPTARGTVDPENPGFYLIAESKAEIAQGDLAGLRRTYANVPGIQLDYSTLVINKPAFPTNDFNGAWSDSTSATSVANIWGAVIATTAVEWKVTGGTYDVRYNGSAPVTLNWNDSAATIQTALNTIITGGVTVVFIETNQVISVTRVGGADLTLVTFDFSNLTGNGGVVSLGGLGTASGAYSFASAHVTWTKTAHGLSASENIRLGMSSTGGGSIAVVQSVPTADTFRTLNPSTAGSTVMSVQNYRTLLRTYTPGTDRVVLQLISSYYLPGVTPGISSAADITPPDVAINDTQLLTLITNSATGFQTYDADPIAHWPNELSPIYVQTLKKINVDDL